MRHAILFLYMSLVASCLARGGRGGIGRKKGTSQKGGSGGAAAGGGGSSCTHYKCDVQYCSATGQPSMNKDFEDRAVCLIGIVNIGNDCTGVTAPQPLAPGVASRVFCPAPGVVQAATLDIWRSENPFLPASLTLPYGDDHPDKANEVMLSANCAAVEQVDCDGDNPVVMCIQNYVCSAIFQGALNRPPRLA